MLRNVETGFGSHVAMRTEPGSLCRHCPIFPGGHPPSIFGTSELNYRVRDGNGWTLTVISTDFCSVLFTQISIKTAFPPL